MFKRLSNAQGILFDLDNTLYPREKGVFDHINRKINAFVREKTGRMGAEVDLLRKDYLRRYGTTLGGLVRHDSVDPDEYLQYVHDVPVEEMLEPVPALVSFIGSIRLPMVIFTNGTSSHARRVMAALGLGPGFKGICDLAATDYLGKPHYEAFLTASRLLGMSLQKTILIDDLPVNVKAGSEYCSFAVHVGSDEDGVGDLHVESVLDLVPVFAEMPWYGRKG